MKKLELKHLDFANNGIVRLTRLPHWDYENVSLQDCELSFNNSSKEPYLIHRGVTFGLSQIKCYKRPLSQLTQEIEHNGGKFVPMDILHELFRKTDLFYFDTYMVLNNPYEVIEKLFEWHFDVFGLIEQNLAIEKL